MFNYGEDPDKVEAEKGERLDIPENVPEEIKQLMKQCWHDIPSQRPCLVDILEVIESVIGQMPEDSKVISIFHSNKLDNPQPVNPLTQEESSAYVNPLDKEGSMQTRT